MTKSSYDSTVSPGPPLPASHPSPGLLAKLHLEASALCASAESLLRIPSSRKHDMEVAEPLLLYARDSASLHDALARKWLGADAGARESNGVAVGFLGWAKRELETLRDGGIGGGGGGGGGGGKKEEGRDGRRERRERISAEAEDVAQFLRYYTRMNDTVRLWFFLAHRGTDGFEADVLFAFFQLSFQPVPSQAELQASVPAGRLAVAAKPFAPPTPAFGPGSVEYIRKHADALDIGDQKESSADGGQRDNPTTSSSSASYAGAGSYF
jgi:hypothetical protein